MKKPIGGGNSVAKEVLMVETSIKEERKASADYRRRAAETDNEEVREHLLEIADDEDEHAKELEELLSELR